MRLPAWRWGRGAPAAAAALLALLAQPAPGGDAGEEISRPHRLHDSLGAGSVVGQVRLRGALVLAPVELDGVGLMGLSGLAWDEDEGLLYALSDRGRIFHLRPRFDDGMLAAVTGHAGFHLRNANGRYMPRYLADSEGLVALDGANDVRGDTKLAVSLEGVPRVLVFKPDGHRLASYGLPVDLRLADRYDHPNRMLEALAWVPGTGLVTGPERPFWNEAGEGVRLYDLDGHDWRYPLSEDAAASLVALEATPDGGVLAMERSFVSPFHPLRIRLRHFSLPAAGEGVPLAVDDVLLMDSHAGWNIDNFEGLTRHRGNRYFMVSDDNGRDFQQTLLVYFEWPVSGDR